MKKTEISELGEFGLIRYLTKNIKTIHETTKTSIGDDAAVLNYKDKDVVITTDLLIEGIHFDLMYTPLKHLGYKAVVVNLSDVYAMNATPMQITVSIAMSKKFSLEAIESLYEGIKLACNMYGVDLVGGDTTSSLSGLLLSITALGEVETDKITYRNGAEENNIICVSGDLGGAYTGLQLLEREKEIYKANPEVQPELSGYDYILERQLKPEARKDVIAFLRKHNIVPTAMIDISDGLSSELLHICNESETGCKVFEDKIPIHPETARMANEFHIDPITCAMNGGEDYELLFTLKPSDYEHIAPEIQRAGISYIGSITELRQGANLIARNGKNVPLMAQGWNAFVDKEQEK